MSAAGFSEPYNLKVNFPVYLTKYYAIHHMYGGVEEFLHTFLVTALDEVSG